jgi:uncharacterized iron-regulated protein
MRGTLLNNFLLFFILVMKSIHKIFKSEATETCTQTQYYKSFRVAVHINIYNI